MAIFNYNGIDLFYEVKGDMNTSKTVVFFNGVMATTNSWDAYWPLFVKMGYKVVLHDFKGQLKSDKPSGPYTFKEHCQEAKALLEYLNISNPHIVGTSYGGEIAMKYAMLYPENTQSITLIDSVSELDTVLIKFVNSWSDLCDLGDGEKFFWGMLPSIYGEDYIKANEAFLERRAKGMNTLPQSYFDGQKILYDTFINEVTMTHELHKIQCPTLVICGEDDILKKPKFSRIIASNIPHAEFMLIPNCGHVAIFEKPEELKSAILGFVLKLNS